MTIFYSLVAKDKDTILAEYTEHSGNFQQLTRQLFQKMRPNSKRRYEMDGYYFDFIQEEGLTVMCMSDDTTERETAIVFLQDVKTTFLREFRPHEIKTAHAYGLNFSDTLRQKMAQYNRSPRISKTKEILADLNEVKDNMVQNLHSMLERDFKLNVVLVKADELHVTSHHYKKHAIQYKKMQRNKKICITIALIIFVIVGISLIQVIIYIILAIFCGWNVQCGS